MPHMATSSWFRLLPFSSIALVSMALGSSVDSRVFASKKSDAVVQSYSFMPGQSMNFPNRKFKRIEVRSTFPVRVLTGNCHEEYVVQFFCSSDQPGDIFVTDRRSQPLFRTPQANEITITEIKK